MDKKNSTLQEVPRELLASFSGCLSKSIGLYYPEERWDELQKKLTPALPIFGFETLSECICWLLSKPLNKSQIDVLVDHLTIGETFFFRDLPMLNCLKKEVFPNIFKRHEKDRTITIWSAGCCTGEEPYSIAIILHQLLPQHENWKIIIKGTDINPVFLEKAKAGLYKKWALRNVSEEILKRYFFKKNEELYELIPAIRTQVEFCCSNLVEGNLQGKMDLILCHNVLIYFSTKEINKIIEGFYKNLSDSGWLSVSAIEAPFVKQPKFSLYHFDRAIFFKKEAPLPLAPALIPAQSKALTIRQPIEEMAAVPRANQYERALSFYKKKNYQAVINLLEPQLLAYEEKSNEKIEIKNYLQELILLISTYSNQGELEKGLEWCEKGLKREKLESKLHYMHALIKQEQREPAAAVASLKKAIFIDPYSVLAFYMLGSIEKEQGNREAARRALQIALKLCEKKSPIESLIIGEEEEFTVDSLKEHILVFLNSLHSS